MVGELPGNVSFGTVIGRFVLAVQDGVDGGTDPDGNAAAGTVTFTPSITRLKDSTATPPTTIIPRAIICTLDSDGILNDPQGSDFVKLIATDDADLEPTGWTWDVAVAITGETTWTFSIAVPAGGTVDLTTVSAVASSTGNSTLGHSEREAAAQVFADGVGDIILWPTSVVTERGGLTHSSLTGVWTIGVDGTYLVTASADVDLDDVGSVTWSARLDGVAIATRIDDTTGSWRDNLTAVFDASEGSEIDLRLETLGIGGTLNTGYATIHRLV